MSRKEILTRTTGPGSLAPRSIKECTLLLQRLGAQTAVLKIKDLQAFWLAIMADKTATHKDRLQASRLYADSIGAFNKDKQQKGIDGARLHWRSKPIEAEIITEE